jgi:hypothetical protein
MRNKTVLSKYSFLHITVECINITEYIPVALNRNYAPLTYCVLFQFQTYLWFFLSSNASFCFFLNVANIHCVAACHPW